MQKTHSESRRIHTHVVWELNTGIEIHDEWYDYAGPVDLCGGGGGDTIVVPPPPPPPPPTPQETQLIENLLVQSELQTTLLKDAIANLQGPDDPIAQKEREARGLAADRLIQGLRGELEVDPAVERELELQDRLLTERIARQFGPGGETSTPAIRARAEQAGVAAATRSGARRGEVQLADLVRARLSAEALSRVLGPLNPAGTAQGVFGLGQTRASLFGNRLNFQSRIAQALAGGGGGGGGLGSIGGILEGAGSLIGGLAAAGAFCHLSAALFGFGTQEHLLAAWYINTQETELARKARKLYRDNADLLREVVAEARELIENG